MIAHKAAYLNLPFFLARAGIYFIVWIGFTLFFLQLSRTQDERGADRDESAAMERQMRSASARS